jgi:hypothetical protein
MVRNWHSQPSRASRGGEETIQDTDHGSRVKPGANLIR